MVGVTIPTVRHWCEAGKVAAIPKPYGTKTTWLISHDALELALKETPKASIHEVVQTTLTSKHLKDWEKAMQSGDVYEQPFSHRTIKDYKGYGERFLKKSSLLNPDALLAYLKTYPVTKIATREKAYKALICFGKYLEAKGLLTVDELTALRVHRPPTNRKPSRPLPCEDQVTKLMAWPMSPIDKAMVALLLYTGIRASELASLRMSHYIPTHHLLRFEGKGCKERAIGLNTACQEALADYLATQAQRTQEAPLLSDSEGKALNRHVIATRLRRLADKAGFKTSPHAFRRYFATKQAMSGRSLATLQRVLGHSNLSTTEQYIRATSLQAAEEMKGWD